MKDGFLQEQSQTYLSCRMPLQHHTVKGYNQGKQTNREAIRPLQNVSKVELADVWSENGSTYGPKSHTALAPQHWPSSIQVQTVMYPDHIPR